jgi:hypothetical protein
MADEPSPMEHPPGPASGSHGSAAERSDAQAQKDGRAEERIKRMSGSQGATEETYVDLHEHCVSLGNLSRWDRAAPLLWAGTLLLGAATGAWAAPGTKFTDLGVLLCGGVGIALLVGGVLLRDERIRSTRDLHASFERKLSLYDDDPRVQAIKARFKDMEIQARERTVAARIGHFIGGIFGEES